MFVFKKEKDPDNSYDTTTVVVESSAITVSQILEDFKDFLMACGYQIKPDSQLVIYEEDSNEL